MVVNDTHYPDNTPRHLVEVLEKSRQSNRTLRLRITYSAGDSECGYVGRSTGTKRIPLLVNNLRSLGGCALLTESIVKVEYSNKRKGGVLWQS